MWLDPKGPFTPGVGVSGSCVDAWIGDYAQSDSFQSWVRTPVFFLERQHWFSIDADAECERTMNSDWSDSCTIIFTETRAILTTYNRKEHYQWCMWHSKLCFICGFLIVYRMEFDKTSWPISRNSDPQNSAHFFVCLKLAPVQLLPIRSLSKLWEK